MAGFKNMGQLALADAEGRVTYSGWRKRVTTATAGTWFDISVYSGNPRPQYYASTPLESVAMTNATEPSMFHGSLVSPSQKILKRFSIVAAVATGIPSTGIVCDYLMYYPFVEEGSTDPLDLVQVDTLPRYTSGEGVQMMFVSQGARGGSQTFQVTYTNSEGVAGRVTPVFTMNNSTTNGNIITTGSIAAGRAGPFLTLQAGDKGVRSIESFQMISGADTGLSAAILVKPLATFTLLEQTAPVEVDYGRDFQVFPIVEDGAVLNFIMCFSGSPVNTDLIGMIETIWN